MEWLRANHWDQWFSDGFGVRQPLEMMVFDGCAPLVRRWNGYVPSLKSNGNAHSVKQNFPVEYPARTFIEFSGILDRRQNSIVDRAGLLISEEENLDQGGLPLSCNISVFSVFSCQTQLGHE